MHKEESATWTNWIEHEELLGLPQHPMIPFLSLLHKMVIFFELFRIRKRNSIYSLQALKVCFASPV
jgi:hypothetical protein